jgi:hypothetical protein
MNAAEDARKALLEFAHEEEEAQARLDLPKKQRDYLAAKDARSEEEEEALKVRCQAFKARLRAAGLQTSFFLPLSEKELTMLEDDAAAADAANNKNAAAAAAAAAADANAH